MSFEESRYTNSFHLSVSDIRRTLLCGDQGGRGGEGVLECINKCIKTFHLSHHHTTIPGHVLVLVPRETPRPAPPCPVTEQRVTSQRSVDQRVLFRAPPIPHPQNNERGIKIMH
ncbi:hypothetical protein E2C01_070247 [Portunus trituberculatus]|uniref:Uncharacterized protein n=1 Tax=Portunus trituberculatus TaxID=210409 RepID=A0A5B7HTP0_PORTR|nr:hypothetical protein [Portunus trituberculatus]